MTPAVRALTKAGLRHAVLEVGSYQGPERQLRLADELGVDVGAVFKTLVAKLDETHLVTVLVPIALELDLKVLAALAGAKRAVMAAPPEAERATGYVVGGISPFGQRRSLRTYGDRSLLDHPRVYVSGGRRGLEIRLDPRDLVALLDASLGELAR
ncbi:MAG: aminoacyl-tRNA deacylase [Acidobacteria bacterium]|nr:MAG: aminoacyl-tRNA deacylase [Acidobacteriota bacterium]REK03242.1 MAG: aminoacyl-tRNA deacylase [Acidobacteriota bacterium]